MLHLRTRSELAVMRATAQVRLVVSIPEWTKSALCARAEHAHVDFFPETGRNDLVRIAKAVCEQCPVRTECLEAVMSRPDHCHDSPGIVGGTTWAERKALQAKINAQRQYTNHDKRNAQERCIHGHEYTPENTGRSKRDGSRYCIACKREKARAYNAKRRNDTTRRRAERGLAEHNRGFASKVWSK